MPSPGESEAKKRVKKIRKQIAGPPEERVDGISPDDREVLIEFDNNLVDDRLDSNRCGWKHHGNVLADLRDFAIHTDGLTESLEDGRDGPRGKKKLTSWIHENYDNGYSVQRKLSAIRVFAMTVLDVDELPKRFAKIEPGKHVTEDPAPLPEEVIEYDELLDMVRGVDLVRDKALLSTQWDTGPRPMEEMWPLQMKQLTIRDDCVIITLPRTNGKTDRRKLLVTVGMPYLKEWLRNHPAWDDPEVPLDRETDTIDDIPPETYIWTKQDKNKLLSYGGFGQRFTVAGERARIGKETSPQHFRRSSASIMARQPEIGERDLRLIYDWSYFSSSPEHYIAAHGKGVLVNVGLARGHEIEHVEDEPDVSPFPCERCHELTMRGIDQCVNCDYNVDVEQETLDRVNRPIENPYADDMGLHEKVIHGHVTAGDLESVEKVSSDIRSMGEKFFDQLSELKRHAKAVQDRDQSNATGVGGFLGMLAGASLEASQRTAAAWAAAKHQALSLDPQMEHYPPSPERATAIGAGLGIYLLAVSAYMSQMGMIEPLLAGEATSQLGLVLGLGLGFTMVTQHLPNLDEIEA